MATKGVPPARAQMSRAVLVRRSLLVVLVLAAGVAATLLQPVRLGLDLRGGTQVVLEARATAERAVDDDTVDRTLEVLRRRVDSLGVAEPTLQRSGDARIIIELPGVTDPEEAMRVIGQTAELTFHPVLGIAEEPGDDDADEPGAADGTGEIVLPDDAGMPLRLGPASLTGDDVAGAGTAIGRAANQFDVTIDFRGQGQQRWQQLTADAACAPPGDPQRRVAIVLDAEVISSPQVEPTVACGQGIGGGSTSITGDFTQQEAGELALLVRAGALPVPVDVVEQRVIGPTLGEAAIEASIWAAILGMIATLLFMVAAYRLYGFIAGLGLALYGLLSYAALTAIGATLTLPGIAGFVLAVGMAVDANVLVFERAKEEFADGMTPRSATETGFKKAFTAVIDSNVTTVIAAVLLIFFASGAVRGFGVTLTIGVVVSMFSALVVVRVIIAWLLQIAPLARRPDVLGLTAWRAIREWLERRDPDMMGHARKWLTGSGIVVALGIVGIVSQGMTWGLDFTGGRLLEYRTAQTVDIDELRDDIIGEGLPSMVVQASADDQVSMRTTDLTPEQETTLLETLRASAGEIEVVRDEFIGPTIGAELRRNALIAMGIALAGQLLYLAIRFRWTYGTAAVVGMAHNVLVLVGVFAWLGKVFDGVFVAALLTIIGYTINDTVVIFDRVRERRAAQPDKPLASLTNRALVQTLPRTFNTGTGALFILIALYVLGGDTLADFALALIIGTTVGMYSSMLVAAPIFLRLEGRWPQPEEPARKGPVRKPNRNRAVV